MCTLDPAADALSRTLHQSGVLTLSRNWKLQSLLQTCRRGGQSGNGSPPPRVRVVDVGAGLGFFTLRAASLGAAVIATEARPLAAALLRASLRLNPSIGGGRGAVRLMEAEVGATDSVRREAGDEDRLAPSADESPALLPSVTIDSLLPAPLTACVLRLSAARLTDALQGGQAAFVQRRIRYLFLRLDVAAMRRRQEEPLLLLQLLDSAGYNIFDDQDAEDGALERSDFQEFLSAMTEPTTVFAARATATTATAAL